MKYLVWGICILLIICAIFGMYKIISNKKTNQNNNTLNKKIVSVQEVSLQTSGMRFTHVYKIIPEDGEMKLERYREVYSDSTPRLELEKSIVCTTDTIVGLMNSCSVLSWNGFHGKHPKNVSDGVMFTFSAIVNDEQVIHADGSENFPKGYNEFVRTLDKMLEES